MYSNIFLPHLLHLISRVLLLIPVSDMLGELIEFMSLAYRVIEIAGNRLIND